MKLGHAKLLEKRSEASPTSKFTVIGDRNADDESDVSDHDIYV